MTLEAPPRITMFRVFAEAPGTDLQDVTDPARNNDNELCFASSVVEAAGIVQTVWRERGCTCTAFRVVEMCLPEFVEAGDSIGLIYQPETHGALVLLDDDGNLAAPIRGSND